MVALLLAGIVLREGINPGLTSPAGSRPLGVELMQGNIPQNEKFLPNGGIETALLWYGDQLMAAQAPLVLLPETALPLLPEQLPPGYWQALQQRFAAGDQAALIGTPAGSFDTGLANAVVGMVPGGAVACRQPAAVRRAAAACAAAGIPLSQAASGAVWRFRALMASSGLST